MHQGDEVGLTKSHQECISDKESSKSSLVEGLPDHGRPEVGDDVLEAVLEVPWMSQN